MLTRLSVPKGLAIPLERAKLRARIDDSDDDVGVEDLIRAATARFERRTNRIMLPTECEWRQDAWCDCHIPVVPIRAVTSVVYLDENNLEQTVPAEHWYSTIDGRGATVRLLPAFTSPRLSDRAGAVRVRFSAGYDDPEELGANPELRPHPMDQQAILMLVAHWYQHRGIALDRQLAGVPAGFEDLVAERRIYR